MSVFQIENTGLPGLKSINHKYFQDDRGSFRKIFSSGNFPESGLVGEIKQINCSLTKKKGTVRGMHFQRPPFSEVKLVSCIAGSVLDVAVDLREASPTFLKWHGQVLSRDNNNALLIPEGFAHGFQALEDNTELLYLHNQEYFPKYEDGVSPLDLMLNIKWPIEPCFLSDRDKSFDSIDQNRKGVFL